MTFRQTTRGSKKTNTCVQHSSTTQQTCSTVYLLVVSRLVAAHDAALVRLQVGLQSAAYLWKTIVFTGVSRRDPERREEKRSAGEEGIKQSNLVLKRIRVLGVRYKYLYRGISRRVRLSAGGRRGRGRRWHRGSQSASDANTTLYEAEIKPLLNRLKSQSALTSLNVFDFGFTASNVSRVYNISRCTGPSIEWEKKKKKEEKNPER